MVNPEYYEREGMSAPEPTPERERPMSLYEITEAELLLDEFMDDWTDPETGEIKGDMEVMMKKAQLELGAEKAIDSILKANINSKARLTTISDSIEIVRARAAEAMEPFQEELDRLRGRFNAQENRIEKRKDLIFYYMGVVKRKKIDTGTFLVWRQNSPHSCDVADGVDFDKWPEEFVKTTKEANTKALKDWYKKRKEQGGNPKLPEGVLIYQNQHLRMK